MNKLTPTQELAAALKQILSVANDTDTTPGLRLDFIRTLAMIALDKAAKAKPPPDEDDGGHWL